MEKLAATVAYALLVAGVLQRKHRPIHPILMSAGIGIDAALVLALQVQRSVIQDAITNTYSFWETGHILSSTVAFALYFPVVWLGVRQWRGIGGASGRAWHIRVALTAFLFRTIGFVLMFTID